MSDSPFEHWKMPEVAAENDDLNREYYEKGEMGKYPYFYELAKAIEPLKTLSSAGEITCLDVGCGSGWQIKYLMSLYPDRMVFSGVDISEHMCERARKNCPDSEFEVANILEYNPGKQWDIVMACGSIEHFEDWPAFIRKMSELSRGWVVVHKAFFTDKASEIHRRTMYHGLTELRVVVNWDYFLQETKACGLQLIRRYDWSGYISGVLLKKI